MSANTQSQFGQPARNSELRIRSGAVHGPLHFVSDRTTREQPRLLAELAGIDVPNQAERFMPVESYLELLARLDHFGDDTAVILQAALAQDMGEVGLFGKAIVHAESLWSALQTLKDGIAHYQPGSSVNIRIRNGRCRVRYHHPFGMGPSQALDVHYTIGLIYNLLSESASTSNPNAHVCYPGAKSEHSRLFGDLGHHSDGEYGVIEFDDHLLPRLLRRSVPSLSEVIFAATDALPMDLETGSEFSTLVRSLQSASIEHQHRPLRQAEISWLLDIPVRTLQHHLKGEGYRFDQLRDKSRHELARQALLKGREIDAIAREIGFSHRQSFSTAFSKWEGCSPSEFRSRCHAGPP